MTPVSLREANIGLNFPCPKCSSVLDTRQEHDDHLAVAHRATWRGI